MAKIFEVKTGSKWGVIINLCPYVNGYRYLWSELCIKIKGFSYGFYLKIE